MTIQFTKMHGLGNDFLVLDLVRQTTTLPTESIQALANRKTGVGFDQLLIVETPTVPDCDFRYRIYNADGSVAQHCGNGARCIARFIHDQGLSSHTTLRLEMSDSIITCETLANGDVSVDMGAPILSPSDIPFTANEQALTYFINLPDGQSQEISAISVGNPHAVLLVEDVITAKVEDLGPIIESHADFPDRVNVGFMQVIDRNNIKLRVYERGTGETLACGTGACAAVVAGQLRGLLDHTVTVELNGGTLNIHCEGANSPILMTGPAISVFEGQFDL